MATHSEAPIESATFASLEGAASDAASIVGVSPSDDPDAIVEAVDAFVFAWQCGKRPSKRQIRPDDAPYALGSLWGQQIVRKFGWDWKMVTFHEHDDPCAPGVLAPDRSLAIYPIHFIIGCLRDSSVDTTIMLSYNMMKAGNIGETPPGKYMNLMEGVFRIVPRIAEPQSKPWWKRLFG